MSSQIKQLIKIDEKLYEEFCPNSTSSNNDKKDDQVDRFIGKRVIVRSYGSGVHVGTVVATDGDVVTLADSSRIWKWEGAFTLSEISLSGVNRSESRISNKIPFITIFGVCELIPVSECVNLDTTE